MLRARAAARAAAVQKRSHGAAETHGAADTETNLLRAEAPRSDHGTFAPRRGEIGISQPTYTPGCAEAAGMGVAGIGAEAAGVGVAAGPLPASPATTALRIWVGTWNLGNHAPPARMDGWLPDPSEGFDVVVVSAQVSK